MTKVKMTPLGLQGTGGLRAEITIGGCKFTGEVLAWPGSENFKKFERVVAMLKKMPSELPSGGDK